MPIARVQHHVPPRCILLLLCEFVPPHSGHPKESRLFTPGTAYPSPLPQGARPVGGQPDPQAAGPRGGPLVAPAAPPPPRALIRRPRRHRCSVSSLRKALAVSARRRPPPPSPPPPAPGPPIPTCTLRRALYRRRAGPPSSPLSPPSPAGHRTGFAPLNFVNGVANPPLPAVGGAHEHKAVLLPTLMNGGVSAPMPSLGPSPPIGPAPPPRLPPGPGRGTPSTGVLGPDPFETTS